MSCAIPSALISIVYCPTCEYAEVRDMVTIRNEMRIVDGEPEIWANLGDVVDWLQELPQQRMTRPVAGAVALEIKQMLLDSVSNAEFSEGS
jgi:hypothetical protein